MSSIVGKCLFLLCFIVLSTAVSAQSDVFGLWKSIDDNTGESKSYIELFEKDGKLYGKITKLLQAAPDAKCESCKGKLKNKPLIGMQVVDGLKKEDSEWKGGKILDPETGNTYKCKIWVDENDNSKLNVRGIHWTGIYRTQQWIRVKD